MRRPGRAAILALIGLLDRFRSRGHDASTLAQAAADVYTKTRDGARIASVDQTATIRVHTIGDVSLPTGRLVACDPLVVPDTEPFTRPVPRGRHPVETRVAEFDDGDQRVACALVRFSPGDPTDWELAALRGQRADRLRGDEYVGYGVDSGTGCFASPEALALFAETLASLDDGEDDPLIRALEETRVDTWDHADLVVGPDDLDVVAFSTGFGDGRYPTYWGLDAQGQLVCAMTEFFVVDAEAA